MVFQWKSYTDFKRDALKLQRQRTMKKGIPQPSPFLRDFETYPEEVRYQISRMDSQIRKFKKIQKEIVIGKFK